MGSWSSEIAAFAGRPDFWPVVILAAGGVWFLSLLISYYVRPTDLWVERFRKVNGLDHTGFFLEAVFCVGLTYTAYHLAVVSYPGAADLLRSGGVLTWVVVGILAAVAVAVLAQCRHTSGTEIPEEVEKHHPDIYDRLKGDWDANRRGLKRQYYVYIFACIAGFWLLVVAVVLFGTGAWEDLSRVAEAKTRLVETTLPTSSGKLDDAELTAARKLVLAYTGYREELLRTVNRFLLPLGLFMLLFFWFLGTRFQELYAPSTRNVYRTLACFFYLVCLPAVVIYASVELISASEGVTAQLNRVAQSGLTAAESPRLAEYIEVQDKMSERATIFGFYARMMASWGGILILLQLALARVERKVAHLSLFANMIPTFVSGLSARAKAIFSLTDEKPADKKPVGAKADDALPMAEESPDGKWEGNPRGIA